MNCGIILIYNLLSVSERGFAYEKAHGDVIIRRGKGGITSYILDHSNGVARERYVGPLTDVVNTYLKVKEGNESGGLGTQSPERARRDLNPGPPAPQAGTPSWLSYGPRSLSNYILKRFTSSSAALSRGLSTRCREPFQLP